MNKADKTIVKRFEDHITVTLEDGFRIRFFRTNFSDYYYINKTKMLRDIEKVKKS